MAKKDKDASVLFELIAKNQGKIKGMDLVKPKKTPEQDSAAPEPESTTPEPSPEAPALPEEKPIDAPAPVIETPDVVEPEVVEAEIVEPEPVEVPAEDAPTEPTPVSDTPLLTQAGLDTPPAEDEPDAPEEPAEQAPVVEALETPQASPGPEASQEAEVIEDAPAPLPVAAPIEKASLGDRLRPMLDRVKRLVATVLAAILTWCRKVPVWSRQLGRWFKRLWILFRPKLAGVSQAMVRFIRSPLAIRILLGVVVLLVLLVIGIKLAPNGATPTPDAAPTELTENNQEPGQPPTGDVSYRLILARWAYSPEAHEAARFLASYCRSQGVVCNSGADPAQTYVAVFSRETFDTPDSPEAQVLLARARSLRMQEELNEQFGDSGESYPLPEPRYERLQTRAD
jgi:hypothetical protein